MGLGLVLSAVLVSGVCAITTSDVVLLDGNAVRVRDVADLACLRPDLRPAFGGLILGTLPEAVSEIRIPRAIVADRLRQHVPGLSITMTDDDNRELIVRRRSDNPVSKRGPSCFVASRPISADSTITAGDLSRTACHAASDDAAVYYDRSHGAVRAASDLSAGTYVGRILVPEHTSPQFGDELLVAVQVGRVAIERQVNAVQPSTGGNRIFVRDASSAVFSVPIEHLAPGGGQ